MKGRPQTFRALTSLEVDEARDLYRQAASVAAAQAGRKGGRLGGGGGAPRAPREFPPIEDFLLALVLVRHPNIYVVDGMFDVPDGAFQAALDAVLPSLFEIRDMPWRFARRLVPLGYRMPASLKRGAEGGARGEGGAGACWTICSAAAGRGTGIAPRRPASAPGSPGARARGMNGGGGDDGI